MSRAHLFVLCLALPACDPSQDTQGDDTGFATCLPDHGEASVAPAGAPEVVADGDGTAQSTLDDAGSPLPYAAGPVLARGSCGTVGLLIEDASTLAFVDLTTGPGTPQTVDSSSAGLESAGLLFDAACEPVVLRVAAGGVAQEFARSGGAWSPPGEVSVADALGAEPAWLSFEDAWTDSAGLLHVLMLADAERGLHGTRAAAAGSAWTFTAFALPDATGFHAFRADGAGVVHALYEKTTYPCDPCDLGLYHGTLEPGGAWTEDVVQASTWGDPDDQYAGDPSLALTAAGEPVVAATWYTRAITGSVKHLELRVYGLADGVWCHEVVAAEVDAYQGSDGSDFTGYNPHLALDAADRPHVVFSDYAQWHDGNNYANAVWGQIRYAVRSGDSWALATLVSQDGQTESPQPLQGLEVPRVVTAADGSQVHVAGVTFSWDTDSIYNSSALPISWQVVTARADVTLP